MVNVGICSLEVILTDTVKHMIRHDHAVHASSGTKSSLIDAVMLADKYHPYKLKLLMLWVMLVIAHANCMCAEQTYQLSLHATDFRLHRKALTKGAYTST